jgi:putative hydrolase of the HAD superfamily
MTESPFDAFHRFESEHGLPAGYLQSVNRRNPDHNAWARFERNELSLSEFDAAFAAECAQSGQTVRGREVIALVYGRVRPQMVRAVRQCRGHFLTACLTNNFSVEGSPAGLPPERAREWAEAASVFDRIIESSKLRVRKPEPRFFELACRQLEIEPRAAVFVDDIGANLKPARAMGMHTIRFTETNTTLSELERILDLPLRS